MNSSQFAMTLQQEDKYLGLEPIKGYTLVESVGAGKIGTVYRAERQNPRHVLACKIISEGKLKKGWQRELEKVLALHDIDNVVQYHSHGTDNDRESRPYEFVMFQFIEGDNLHDYLDRPDVSLDMPFAEMLLVTVLDVLFACQKVGIVHGDLHDKNILIARPDPRVRNSRAKVYVADFGYGGSHNEVLPKDDFQELANIVADLLRRLTVAELDPRSKALYEPMKEFAAKRLRDASRTQHAQPERLIVEFDQLREAAQRASDVGSKDDGPKTPADYMWAEAMGFQKEEWRSLFVPEFLGAEDLLGKNNTILTGARGCGKTMVFRRLTELMDQIVGEPSGVKGADQFVGFYVNCRSFMDAFPWLPKPLKPGGQQQIMHFFHLAWFNEVCKTLGVCPIEDEQNHEWLDQFARTAFGTRYMLATEGTPVLAHVRAFIETEKERCRVLPLNSCEGLDHWPLARMDFLESLQEQLQQHVPWVGNRPLYLFLDDYTHPIIPTEMQRVLNPIIFKRRHTIYFKVSTESANSIALEGIRGKQMEVHHDFVLLDLASVSLHQPDAEKKSLLNKVFIPRINRHEPFVGKNLGLPELLGDTPYSSNELAWNMRNPQKYPLPGGKPGGKRLYWGCDVFAGMWASDIRTMVEMFADMLREANGQLDEKYTRIPETIQDRCCRYQGGEFLAFAQAIRDHELLKMLKRPRRAADYGNHLKNIVQAFVNVARHDLTKGPLVDNQGTESPKQAFRIEILDSFKPADEVAGYYEGLIRYHIFLQDWRGKSQRGMLTPRLYLNRILLPYVDLTFSGHDHIRLTNSEFNQLLANPGEFPKYYREKPRKNKSRCDDTGTPELGMGA
jgi:hypothetical protein